MRGIAWKSSVNELHAIEVSIHKGRVHIIESREWLQYNAFWQKHINTAVLLCPIAEMCANFLQRSVQIWRGACELPPPPPPKSFKPKNGLEQLGVKVLNEFLQVC